MRIDLFLWYTRIFKSRTIASNSCKKGHIKIDGKSVKYWFNFDIESMYTKPLDVLWIRITLTDDKQTIQLPNPNSMFAIKKYFALKFN